MAPTDAGEGGRLWGGRFTGPNDPLMDEFNQSLMFDKKMYKEDVDGSIAYASALTAAGLLTQDECAAIHNGLEQVKSEWESGYMDQNLMPSDEDIHTANERRLGEIIGTNIAGKLHTGRSRNDQVATDTRLWLIKHTEALQGHVRHFLQVVCKRAEEEVDVLMPGYTHLQRAQPIRWSHWMLSHAWNLVEDLDRLQQASVRINSCPLGSGALAGNPFKVDRHALAKDLGFTSVTENSLKATCDRDFVAEFLFIGTMITSHLSRWAEDLIIYSTKEFSFVTLADAYSTGSSLMPQKKNPDSLELIRGKAGRLQGQLTTLLIAMKGLPSTYNKDLQEDKEPLFDAVDTLTKIVQIATGVMSTLTIDKEAMRKALSVQMLATDVAYYLVRRGVPFRQAHGKSGEVVRAAEELGCDLDGVPLDRLKQIDPNFGEDVTSVWDFDHSVEQYDVYGGTAKTAVLGQVQRMAKKLGA
eukprot:Clim_evm4s163 gene=Clim_evmTU4s163